MGVVAYAELLASRFLEHSRGDETGLWGWGLVEMRTLSPREASRSVGAGVRITLS